MVQVLPLFRQRQNAALGLLISLYLATGAFWVWDPWFNDCH